MDTQASWLQGMAPALACAVLHSLWQGALLALAAACTLAAMQRSSAAARHTVGMLFLAAMVATPALRFGQFWPPPANGLHGAWLQPVATLDPISTVALALQESSPLANAVALLWLIGVGLALLRHLFGLWTIHTTAQHPHEPLPPAWLARTERLRITTAVARTVLVRVSSEILVPCTARLLRPVIWLPASLLTRMPADQLEALLAHEFAHIARKDWLWNGVQCVLESLLFFHPAAWWLSRRIRQEREHACDDLAVAACGKPIALAEALAALEHQRRASPRLVLAANGGALLQRITRLLSAPSPRSTWLTSIGSGVVLAVGLYVAAQQGISHRWKADDRLADFRSAREVIQLDVAQPPPPPAPPDITTSAAFRVLMQQAALNPMVRTHLGLPLRVGNRPVIGRISLGNGEGYANLRFVLHGPKGRADAHMIAHMRNHAWRIEAIDLH